MQLNNSDIINRLIENQKDLEISSDLNEETQEDLDIINRSRVASLKYKLYLFLVIIAIYIMFANFVSPALDKLNEKRSALASLQTDVTKFDSKKKLLEEDKSLIDNIKLNSGNVIACLNENKDCSQIGTGLRKNFSIVRSYLQIWDLSSKKMVVNEKLILANIDEYLIRNMQAGDITKNSNGSIDKISIWEPVKFEWKLYYVPVRLNISFENKDYLLDFISNVERKVLVDKDYRILYKIDQVSYNIVQYQDKQNVDIVLVAYYYQG